MLMCMEIRVSPGSNPTRAGTLIQEALAPRLSHGIHCCRLKNPKRGMCCARGIGDARPGSQKVELFRKHSSLKRRFPCTSRASLESASLGCAKDYSYLSA